MKKMLMLVMGIILGFAGGAWADTHYVDENSTSPSVPYDSWATAAKNLQDAIDAASSNDTVLVTNGTYSSGWAVTPGYGLHNRVCITENITVESVNGPEVTTIDGGNSMRAAYLSSGTLSGFTLTHGQTWGAGGDNWEFDRSGGGLWLGDGATATNCTVSESWAATGGGVFFYQGGTLVDCVVSGNTSANEGGGVRCENGGTILDCTIEQNNCRNYGGGMFLPNGSPLIERCEIKGNSCSDSGSAGGGIYCFDHTLVVSECIIADNTSSWDGGGMYKGTLNNSLVYSNSAVYGGGVYQSTANSCTLSGNSANTYGGGCFEGTMMNCIVIGNSCGTGSNHYYGSYSYCCTTPLAGGTGNMDGDPLFVDPANGDYRLQEGSPCIGAGTNQSWMADASDLDGNSRIIDGFVDMGAYECRSVHYVALDGLSIWPYTRWDTAATNIQDAVDAAESNDIVRVNNGTYSLADEITVAKIITLESLNGAEMTVVDGQGTHRCFNLGSGCTLRGFSVTNGSASYGSGGGVTCADTSSMVSNCIISGNSAEYAGGGMYKGTADNCLFTSNSAEYGGGIYKGTLDNCTIRGNSAESGGGSYDSTADHCLITGNLAKKYGAGMCYGTANHCTISGNESWVSGSSGGGLSGGTANNCLIIGNSAPWGGGMRYSTARNCTISGNSASLGGGSHESTLVNCIVSGNSASYSSVANYSGANYDGGSLSYCCTTPLPSGPGNISDDPLFVDAAAGNYRLQVVSPCINAGTNSSAMGNTDLDGNSRMIGGLADMGAYENLYPVAIFIVNESMTVSSDVDTVDLEGTSTEWMVGSIVWSNAANGTTGTFHAVSNWSVTVGPLVFGENLLTVSGTNSAGDSAADSVVITRDTMHVGDSPVHYVSTNGSAIWPFTNWVTAATSIQDAVNAAASNDAVRVSDGTYSVESQITVSRPITLESVNGAEVTVVDGQDVHRCFNLGSGCALSGFAITNGLAVGVSPANNGGGIYCTDTSSIVSHCIITGNSAGEYGGGMYNGTVNNCLITGNSATYGGGSYASTLNNCTISGNSANVGGGARYADLVNCIVVGNSATSDGANCSEGSFSYCCTTPLPDGTGNIDADPLFVDAAAGNYRLHAISPCNNVGNNAAVVRDTDLAGNPRMIERVVDMGAYEHSAPVAITIANESVEVASEIDTLDLRGAATEQIVGTIVWTNAANTVRGQFPASTNWLVSDVPLAYGANLITVSGANVLGDVVSDSVTITRLIPEHTGNSQVHYASTNGLAVWPYTNWTTAATYIQDAVDAAASNESVRIADGIYCPPSEIVVSRGISLESVNGAEMTIVDGQGERCCFSLGRDCTLSGLTVTGGWASGRWKGGGITCSDTSSLVFNCIITGNSAEYGGGMHNGTASNCLITGNTASFGGGLFHSSANDCTITNNSGYHGSGIYCNDTTPVISNCIISDNRAGLGGYGGGSTGGTLIHCIISDNSANDGGGIYESIATNCNISSNSATVDGGGIYRSTAHNCLITGNSARDGAGVFSSGTYNCTISSNSASGKGGGCYDGRLFNCIVVGNSAGDSGQNYQYGIFRYSCMTPYSGGAGNIDSDPQFMDAPSGNFRLPANSPCIDVGDPSISSGPADLAGTPRPLDGDADGTNTIDMGCYEYLNAAADSDDDGLTDGEEVGTYGTDPTDDNSDNDPHSDGEEFIADTDGTDPDDYFRISSISNSTVEFTSSSNRLYTLYCSTNLISGQWLEVGSQMGAGGADYMSGTNVVPQEYFRLEVALP